jgi:DNA-binding response OmpR family regulator
MSTKLLIAEDDALFRRILTKSLSLDFDVAIAEDGLTAWEMLKRNQDPMIALLDWVMPGMTGPEVCRQVRKTLNQNTNYLILLTARNTSADIIGGLAAGADDYITKPFQPEELRARVHLGQRILQLQTAPEQKWTLANKLDSREFLSQKTVPVSAFLRHR